MENKKQDKIFPNFDPTTDLSQASKSRRLKRGLGAQPLLESEIRDAQSKARSAMEAARILGVSFNTYKKYSKQYGIFEDLKNPDGTGIRDYIHVVDLVDGHLKALEYVKKNMGVHIWNLGVGRGYSVLEIINAFENTTGKSVPF
jgi:UDP-glucose 4-epimerase